MRVVQGDLIALAVAGRFDAIVHGCNCFHAMGAGIARAIAQRFPQALEADKQTDFGARDKLGTISAAQVEQDGHRFCIVNAYTQYHYDGAGPLVEYSAVARCFAAVAEAYPGQRIGYPLIGAGLAGGDWQRIAPLIDSALDAHDHCLVVLPDNMGSGSRR